MDNIRQRKLVNENGNKSTRSKDANKKKKSKSYAPSIKGQLICVLLSGLILLLFTGFYLDSVIHTSTDRIAKHLGYKNPVYAAIVDAGSTGSRILVFSFHKAYLDGRLILDKELFIQQKPGLSSFVNEPAQGAESINKLLAHAYEEIPKEYWSQTHLQMKATAGLRMLPEKKANALLDAVRVLFKSTPFITDENSVEIADGVDEGIFSWVTVNFLQDLMNGQPEDTAAALDLGGGSTQVTFAATTKETKAQKEYIHPVQAGKQSIKVWTNSFLGLGLKAARKEILVAGNNDPKNLNIISDCVNPIINDTKWLYNGKEFSISGNKQDIRFVNEPVTSATTVTEKKPVVKFEKCIAIVEAYVKKLVKTPKELATKKINAFSYYFDRAAQAGLIDPLTGGKVPVKNFLDAAKLAAKQPYTDQPFMTVDLTFIYVLLKDGFGLPPTTELNLYKKINGHETSWALGAALRILQS